MSAWVSFEGSGVYVADLIRNATALNYQGLDGDESKLRDGETLVYAPRAEIDE